MIDYLECKISTRIAKPIVTGELRTIDKEDNALVKSFIAGFDDADYLSIDYSRDNAFAVCEVTGLHELCNTVRINYIK